jgi:hypothetical protein
MGGAYAMGAPWHRFAGACGPEWSHLSDWLAKMTASRGPRSQQGFGQWGGGFGGAPFGPWWGPGRPWRAQKARRGDVRAAILAVLAEQSMNGYQIIQEIATRSGGVWRSQAQARSIQLCSSSRTKVVRVERWRPTQLHPDRPRSYVTENADGISSVAGQDGGRRRRRRTQAIARTSGRGRLADRGHGNT